jgi:aminoglycoside 3-N-acetyltransferase
MAFRDTLRSWTPEFLLQIFRDFQRKKTRKAISNKLENKEFLILEDLEKNLIAIGIEKNDSVLVHCAFSKLGPVEGGPATFIQALKNVVTVEGNILMPSSPNASFQLEYIQNLKEFDVQNEPSKMGWLSEVFRKEENVLRSAHPTEPVCVWGVDANWFVDNHEMDGTAYGKNSPFYKLTEKKGKILYIGVTLDNAGTSLHVLEDAVENFPYPVYTEKSFEVKIKNGDKYYPIETKVHNPNQSKLRRCDELLPMFEASKCARKVQIGEAPTWVFDAKRMLDCMLDNFHEKGVTMYTPAWVKT